MSGVIDTNLLLYAANRDCREHARAVEFLTGAARSPDRWYLSDGIVYEFLRVSTHPRVFPAPLDWRDAMSFARTLLDSPAFALLRCGDRHWDYLLATLEPLTHPAGNLFFDIRTVALMREAGVREIYTADTDFLQFEDIEVHNPLRG